MSTFVLMQLHRTINFRPALRPLALAVLLLVTVGAFATLGDGKKKSTVARKIMSSRTMNFNGNFSLRSGYNFRGNTILQSEQKVVVRINTNISVGKGNNSFTIPLRRQSIIPQLKLELGNRSMRPY